MSNNGSVVSGCSGKCATVTGPLLDVADDGSFGEGRDGEDVSDGEGGLLAAVDELTGVLALGGDEGLGLELVSVGVAEDDSGERSATAAVVDDILDDSSDVSVSLSEIKGPQTSWVFVEPGVGFELEDSQKSRSRTPNVRRIGIRVLRMPLLL